MKNSFHKGGGLKVFLVIMLVITIGMMGAAEEFELPQLNFGGYNDGYAAGYEAGYKDGKYDWKEIFYENGYEDGYSDGVAYGRGLQAAVDKGSGISKPSNNKTDTVTASDVVYVTRTGTKYHKFGCQYLRESCVEIERKKAVESGYDACSKCY